MNPIDRIVGYFNPDAGLRRKRARALLARAYEGASSLDGWRPRRPGASANTDHRADSRMLRLRARSLVQNVPYCDRGLQALVSATIGTGLEPRSESDRYSAAIDALWADWSKRADADGIFDIYGLQAAAYRAMEQDGEVLIRRRRRKPNDGLPVPLQVQLLEIDWLDDNKHGALAGGGQIVNGIQYDAIGRIVGYWLYDAHPGDTAATSRFTSRMIPASEIIHLFNPRRPGQGRGITRFASIIARTRDLMLYEDAELQRKNLETRLGVLVSGAEASELSNPGDLPRGPDGSSGVADASLANSTGDLGVLPSGGIVRLPDNMNVNQIEPKTAVGYVEYCKWTLHLIAAGLGVPYESMTGDMKEVSFSSARIRQIEFRRDIEQMQWLVVIPRLCGPLWQWFIEAAELSGQIKSGNSRVDWSTPRWDYVNPAQDVQSEIDAIGAGLITPSESLRRRGYKPEQVFAELGSDFAALKKAGAIELMSFFRKSTQGPATPP